MKDDIFGTQSAANSLIVRDPAAIAAAESAKARIQAAYIMALQKPRSEEQARARILAACRRPEFARRVEYNKPVGGKGIKGPSIRFAELALREWQNIDSDIYVVFEDSTTKRVKIRLLDLETNAAFSKEISIQKTVERKNSADRVVLAERVNTRGETVYVVLATEDELMNKEAALISKALRNEGLRLIPSDIVDEALETARQTQYNQDAQDPASAKKAILDGFASIGVMPTEIEKYLGHKLDTIVSAELADLRSVYQAIRDGESSWSDYLDLQAVKTENKLAELKERLKNEKAPKETPKKPAQASPEAQGEAQAPLPISTQAPSEEKPKAEPIKENPAKAPKSELEVLNEKLSGLLKTSTLKVRAALINCKLNSKLTEFKSTEEAGKFFTAFDNLKK